MSDKLDQTALDPAPPSIVTDRRFLELLEALAMSGTEEAYNDAFTLLVRHLDTIFARHQNVIQTLMTLNAKLAEMAASVPQLDSRGIAVILSAARPRNTSSQVDPCMAMPPIPCKPAEGVKDERALEGKEKTDGQ